MTMLGALIRLGIKTADKIEIFLLPPTNQNFLCVKMRARELYWYALFMAVKMGHSGGDTL